MATYLLKEDGSKFALEDSSGFILLEVQDAVVTTTAEDRTHYGGGEEEIERYKADRRRKLEAAERRKEELKLRLAKAEQDRERKANARAQAKSRKAIEARIEKINAELVSLDALIAQLIDDLELSILDRKRRLLLISLIM